MNLDLMIDLRRTLHNCPELSGCEETTKRMLIDFLKAHTSLEIHSCGNGFYAAHREVSPKKPSLALRADYDAIALPDGTAAHLCGHDGHAAALCGAALLTEGNRFDRNIFFLFQPAEEVGTGALECTELFRRESVSEIYGMHNLPGLPFGSITTCPGTFACASCGLTLKFLGKPAHAAYPENGTSPAEAVGKLLCAIPKLSEPGQYTGMTLLTVIGVQMGRKAFGSAAADGEVWLTLRAEHDCDLETMYRNILNHAKTLASDYGLSFSAEMQDVFPATENDEKCALHVLNACNGSPLAAPMRWSEDFGHYLKSCPGAFFGIGAGEDHPPLHTERYEYPDALLAPAIDAFYKLMMSECQ